MKERIDHTNYEAWLLDRLEGNLSPSGERALVAFLGANPGLDPGPIDLPKLNEEGAPLPGIDKDALKRTLPPVGVVNNERLEDHLIAQLEGDLAPEQVLALQRFLNDHPEHHRTERLYSIARFDASEEHIRDKDELRRALPPTGRVTRFTLQDHLVARLEGDLNAAQDEALAAYFQEHPSALREWELMQQTRTSAAPITYPDKASLKREARIFVLTPWAVRLAAAASLALLLGAAFWFFGQAPNVEQQVADRSVTAPMGPDTTARPSTHSTLEQVKNAPEGPLAHTTDPKSLVLKKSETPTALPDGDPTELPQPRPEREPGPQLAESRTVVPEHPLAQARPLEAFTSTPNTGPEDETIAALPAGGNPRFTLGGLLAAKLRERVLEKTEPDTRPLDGEDALAAMDRGLRALAGEEAGLRVERKDPNGLRTYNLRLGRNLALTANSTR